MDPTYIITDGSLTLQLELSERGIFTVTSPFVPGLVTEAKSVPQAFENARICIADLAEADKKPFVPDAPPAANPSRRRARIASRGPKPPTRRTGSKRRS